MNVNGFLKGVLAAGHRDGRCVPSYCDYKVDGDVACVTAVRLPLQTRWPGSLYLLYMCQLGSRYISLAL